MSSLVSAYNGEPLTAARERRTEGNTVGSLTGTQCSIITGSLLGDGAMRCKVNALLEINHSLEQKFYVDWKHQQLANLVTTPPKARKGNGDRIAYRFTTRSLSELTPFYYRFYSDRRKVIPDDLTLDPLSLAVWFMDDGCKSHRALYLNTQQFDQESQMRLIESLRATWSVKATLNRDKRYQRIRIAVESVSIFKAIVAPHLLPQFQYKFPS
ncbi:MAG: LAGLIDADG endonuclease [Acidobacteriota bacterium]